VAITDMRPSRVSAELRRIAVGIDVSKNPSLSLVLAALKRVADELEPEFVQDVHGIMEKGLPRGNSSPLIKSNYLLENADIFITFPVKFYDENDKPTELPDTMETQQQLMNAGHSRPSVLVVWPDVDILIQYDIFDGRADTSQSHGDDVWPNDVGANNIQDVMAAMGPGSLVTNSRFKELAALHGYQTAFMLEY